MLRHLDSVCVHNGQSVNLSGTPQFIGKVGEEQMLEIEGKNEMVYEYDWMIIGMFEEQSHFRFLEACSQ